MDNPAYTQVHAISFHVRSRWAFIAVFSAASVGSRIAMASIPNIKFVTFFAVMAGMIGGPTVGFSVGFLSMFASDAAFFGVGSWTLATSSSMGLVGIMGGLLWFGRGNKFPPRLELGVLGYLMTLAYDLLTSLLNLPLLLHILYDAPATTMYAVLSIVLGLFSPLGGFLWPAGIAHELVTAILLALAAPQIMKRIRPVKREF